MAQTQPYVIAIAYSWIKLAPQFTYFPFLNIDSVQTNIGCTCWNDPRKWISLLKFTSKVGNQDFTPIRPRPVSGTPKVFSWQWRLLHFKIKLSFLEMCCPANGHLMLKYNLGGCVAIYEIVHNVRCNVGLFGDKASDVRPCLKSHCNTLQPQLS